MRKLHFLLVFVLCSSALFAQQQYQIRGRITDKANGEPLPFVNVAILNTSIGAVTDSLGYYVIPKVLPGMYRVKCSFLGYEPYISSEFRLSSGNYRLNVEMQESGISLGEVEVVASPFRRSTDSPLALKVISIQEIEKSPGANRDISRVVNNFPGVASTVGGGYRNDLLVRGGGPSENRFYLDGVEIPNINHFSTQGASGGPIGIIDADFIREVNFYTGAFPSNRGNALSSVLDFKLQDGNPDKNSVKATVGASEVALGVNGHIGEKTTYLVSVRQSYLQLLFRILDMPFLPKFTDAQFKIKTRFSKAHELSFIGLGAIDNMTLNFDTDPKDESRQYLLSYLPKIRQNTYTLGAVYKHYKNNHIQTAVLSQSYLDNRNTKYTDNDDSSPDNLILKYTSREMETRFRFENSTRIADFTINSGVNLDYADYNTENYQKLFIGDEMVLLNNKSDLGIMKWGIFASAAYESVDRRFTASLGVRFDGNDYSSAMNNLFKQFSPRLSLSYRLFDDLRLNGNVGRFYQLPAYTTMGYKNKNGIFENKDNGLTYMRSDQAVLGLEYEVGTLASVTWEGFYKKYDHGAMSVSDLIPLACKGVNYGVTGNEAAVSTAKGRAYGTEVMIRWIGRGKFNLITSYTFVRSEFIRPETDKYIPSAWDNRHLLTVGGTYRFPKNWDFGLKFRAMGGAPYTPYDEEKSSLIEAWDVQGRPYYDYALYNSRRLNVFTQLDLRVDKTFYFKGVMFGIYLDLQNILNQKYNNPPAYISTGEKDPDKQGHYKMKYITQQEGTILPTLGITVEF